MIGSKEYIINFLTDATFDVAFDRIHAKDINMKKFKKSLDIAPNPRYIYDNNIMQTMIPSKKESYLLIINNNDNTITLRLPLYNDMDSDVNHTEEMLKNFLRLK